MNADENAAIQTAHLDRAVTRAKRLADLLHHRPTRDDLDLEAAELLVYVTWLLERDSASRKLALSRSFRIGETLRRFWEGADVAAASSESHGDGLNGSGSVQDTGDAPEGQQGTDEDDLEQLRVCLDIAEHDRDAYRKRWHEAASELDALLQTAKDVVQLTRDDQAMPKAQDRLGTLVEALEAGGCPFVPPSADRLRRELWHVLDRMPAGDDDLIAAVRKLVERASDV